MAKRGRKRKFAARYPSGEIVKAQQTPRPRDDVGPTDELVAHRAIVVGAGNALDPDAGWEIGKLYLLGLLDDRRDRGAAIRRRDAGERLCKIMARYERQLCLPRPPKAADMARTDGSVDNEDNGEEYRLAMRDYQRCRSALATRGWQVQAATLRAAKEERGWRVDHVIEGLDAISEVTGRKSQEAA